MELNAMNDLDTLRPEVREALEVCTRGVDCVSFGDNDAPQIIRAELLRLARENDEWQMRCLQFQTERDHARQMHADRDVDVQHEWARAEAAEAELAEASETIKRLNHRVQVADAGVAEKVMRSSGRGFGRSLANAAAEMFRRERDEARAELAALKARIDGSRHAFLGPNMDRITFLAEDIGPVGKYALVKVED